LLVIGNRSREPLASLPRPERGWRGAGSSRAAAHLDDYQNVKWVADVPGWGWSCPVVWGDRVFLTAVIADQQTRVPQQGVVPGTKVFASRSKAFIVGWFIASI
jgi:hypothetical protein